MATIAILFLLCSTIVISRNLFRNSNKNTTYFTPSKQVLPSNAQEFDEDEEEDYDDYEPGPEPGREPDHKPWPDHRPKPRPDHRPKPRPEPDHKPSAGTINFSSNNQGIEVSINIPQGIPQHGSGNTNIISNVFNLGGTYEREEIGD